jgi:hypothetical protein
MPGLGGSRHSSTAGPNPSETGLTPYSGYVTLPTTLANPPEQHPLHPAAHTHAMHHFHKSMAAKAALAGDTTSALNREELARINSGNLSSPPLAGSSRRLPSPGPKP